MPTTSRLPGATTAARACLETRAGGRAGEKLGCVGSNERQNKPGCARCSLFASAAELQSMQSAAGLSLTTRAYASTCSPPVCSSR